MVDPTPHIWAGLCSLFELQFSTVVESKLSLPHEKVYVRIQSMQLYPLPKAVFVTEVMSVSQSEVEFHERRVRA